MKWVKMKILKNNEIVFLSHVPRIPQAKNIGSFSSKTSQIMYSNARLMSFQQCFSLFQLEYTIELTEEGKARQNAGSYNSYSGQSYR